MTNLERRALLGDKQAQEECTRQEIMLPCWRCGGEAEVNEETGKSGHYKPVMNVDEFGVLTMANEVARALFGHTESKEATP